MRRRKLRSGVLVYWLESLQQKWRKILGAKQELCEQYYRVFLFTDTCGKLVRVAPYRETLYQGLTRRYVFNYASSNYGVGFFRILASVRGLLVSNNLKGCGWIGSGGTEENHSTLLSR